MPDIDEVIEGLEEWADYRKEQDIGLFVITLITAYRDMEKQRDEAAEKMMSESLKGAMNAARAEALEKRNTELAEALERIRDASAQWAAWPQTKTTFGEVRYAHESTKRLCEATLTPKGDD